MKPIRRLFLFTFSLISTISSGMEHNDVIRNDQASGERIKQIFQPTFISRSRVEFNLNSISLKSGESAYMVVPASLSNKVIDFVALTHRQDPNDEKECKSADPKWDCLMGLTALQVYDRNRSSNEAWRYWSGLGTGIYNSKFAEVSEFGEVDNLYEWLGHGTISVTNGSQDYDGVRPLLIRVKSVGPDSVIAKNVMIKFLPERPTKMDDFIFSRGFNFGDYASARGRVYPGNSEIGDYGTSMALNYMTAVHAQLPSNWQQTPQGLKIPLKSGMRLSFVDVAGGDMRRMPTGGKQNDYRGKTALSIYLVREFRTDTIMDSENVGMTGVMRAIDDSAETIQEGDFLLIQPTDLMQVMGIRIGYAN